jgi:hypothetical protein
VSQPQLGWLHGIGTKSSRRTAEARALEDRVRHVRERQAIHRVHAELVAPRPRRGLHRHELDHPVRERDVEHVADLVLVHAARERHRELHRHAEPVEVGDDAPPQLGGLGAAHLLVGLARERVELEEDDDLVGVGREARALLGLREAEAVRRHVDLLDAGLLHREVHELPEARVERGLAARDLERVDAALLRDELAHVRLEELEGEVALSFALSE